ncbi:transporter substrate-binding domain-containing protein [Curvibacter sp. CHRR-16]|uniref:transporter substrate-binding domain-containing protein n=1 Tax=Curvibacter sp. CHRR-16 TaxID=2835872 RepID=UPI001BD91ECE|nr:transporter substrate-binding domain-containing protein [Curvibacter sp. CHRR-16]MBT0569774.1 transporter substrate-binding domain-containing protein [Curvibacter sp. CHRR-16]
MNRRFLALRALAAVAGLCFSLTVGAQVTESSAARVQRTKTLRIGVVAGAIPYYNKNLETGKWEGFGPDFAEDLAKKLGAKLEFVETTWGNAVLDLQSNKIDVMFGMAPTPARKEVVNFSETLFENTYTAVCRKGLAPTTWEQLNKSTVKIAVDVGSSHDQFATKSLPQADVQRLENSSSATLALQAGKADCQVLVILLAQPLLAKRASIGSMYVPTPVFTAPVSIGLQKEADLTMQKNVNKWLEEYRGRGEVRRVILSNMEKLAGVPASAFTADIKF